MYIDGILSHDIHKVWPQVKPLLEKAYTREHSTINEQDVLRDLLTAKQQLWIGHNGKDIELALTTKIDATPTEKVAHLVLMGGVHFFTEGKKFYPIIEAWARHNGCDKLVSYVRKDIFKRVLKQEGFEFVESTKWGLFISKPLTSDQQHGVNKDE